MEAKYKIGDVAWYANRERKIKWLECPHCFGQKALTVILGDGSQVSIDCECCRRGLEAWGRIESWEEVVAVKQITINRVEVFPDKVEYGFYESYRTEEINLFDTKEDAEVRAEELAEEYRQEEFRRLEAKDKYSRKWSWHVYYHRNAIKEAQRQIAYHTAKLNVAKTKSKQPDVEETNA